MGAALSGLGATAWGMGTGVASDKSLGHVRAWLHGRVAASSLVPWRLAHCLAMVALCFWGGRWLGGGYSLGVWTSLCFVVGGSLRCVGLTGGIACGKSTVSRLLKEEHGALIIDADLIARQVLEKGTRHGAPPPPPRNLPPPYNTRHAAQGSRRTTRCALPLNPTTS